MVVGGRESDYPPTTLCLTRMVLLHLFTRKGMQEGGDSMNMLASWIKKGVHHSHLRR